MKKMTDAEKQVRAEHRTRFQATSRRLAQLDTLLSGLLAVSLIIWLAVYVREGNLQNALGSVEFWLGFLLGAAILVFLVRKFFISAKVARKS